MFYFFFSSRRRHTRYIGDWSSDVCSSDLQPLAIGQADIKRLIAYTSISHFGLIALGIFVLTSQGQAGATLYMVNHGFATGALFLVAGFMIARRRSQRIADYGGVQKVAPVLAGMFLIAGLAGLSLPGLSTFVS